MQLKWRRRIIGAVAVAFILGDLLYFGDWAVLHYRVSRGTGYGTVEVNQFLATSLKGNKTEYDLTGTAQQQCVRSIFPHQGYSACWWLQRHQAQWQ